MLRARHADPAGTAFSLDLRVPRILHDLEAQGVAKVEATGLLAAGEDVVGAADQPQIDVLCCPRSLESKLDHQPAFENDRVLEDAEQAGQEPIEDEELAPALQVHPRDGCLTSVGDTPAVAQSITVYAGVVTWTAPDQVLSVSAKSKK